MFFKGLSFPLRYNILYIILTVNASIYIKRYMLNAALKTLLLDRL